jgi:hypothetical protein
MATATARYADPAQCKSRLVGALSSRQWARAGWEAHFCFPARNYSSRSLVAFRSSAVEARIHPRVGCG